MNKLNNILCSMSPDTLFWIWVIILLGLESILVEAMINISKELKFEGLLLDVYQTEWKFMGLLMDMGFKVTGSLPKCGYVKGKGYVDSILLYKEFIVGSCKL